MKCFEVTEWLEENFTSERMELTSDISAHLDSCESCREFYSELVTLEEALLPLVDISLTPEESTQLSDSLESALGQEPAAIPVQPSESNIFSISRIIFAAAAVLVMVFLSSSPTQIDITVTAENYDNMQYSSLDDYDMASIITDSDEDLLPSLFDQTSAAYLASQLQPGQVDDILETLTDDDIVWLAQNYGVEI